LLAIAVASFAPVAADTAFASSLAIAGPLVASYQFEASVV